MLNTVKDKVDWVVGNTILNATKFINAGEDYDYWKEALEWAKSERYFPELSEVEFLKLARQYESWIEFEQNCKLG